MVSVIIPAYNRAAILPRAIQSVLEQSYADFEVIIVDDASTDQTADVIKCFNDGRIVYIRHSTNKGGAAARNTGIERSRGEFVAFLDSDDQWLPGKLQQQMERFKSLDESFGVVYTGIKVIYEGTDKTEVLPAQFSGQFLNELLISNCVRTTSSIVVRRKYLQRINGFDAQLKSCQDWDLYIRLMKHCKFGSIESPMVLYSVDKKDPSRISNLQKSIVQGHELIAEKYKEDYQKLSAQDRVRYYESVSEMYSLGGNMIYPVAHMLAACVMTGRLKYFIKAVRYFLRYFKKQLTGNFGY